MREEYEHKMYRTGERGEHRMTMLTGKHREIKSQALRKKLKGYVKGMTHKKLEEHKKENDRLRHESFKEMNHFK